jgi:hypothetical protein
MYNNKLELYSSSDNITMLAFVHRWRPHLSKNPNEISTVHLDPFESGRNPFASNRPLKAATASCLLPKVFHSVLGLSDAVVTPSDICLLLPQSFVYQRTVLHGYLQVRFVFDQSIWFGPCAGVEN